MQGSARFSDEWYAMKWIVIGIRAYCTISIDFINCNSSVSIIDYMKRSTVKWLAILLKTVIAEYFQLAAETHEYSMSVHPEEAVSFIYEFCMNLIWKWKQLIDFKRKLTHVS